MRQADTRKILFVLGMHRSGTSALCAALQACGASFGTDLLQPMGGVNEEGFWEDAELVAVNERLLEAAGVRWYSATTGLLQLDWHAAEFDTERELAREILGRGFGAGPLETVKDPRLCLTLPFWTALCAEMAIDTAFCAINRAPLEVARSLERRDGFPPGYGLRLYQLYSRGIARHVSGNITYVAYDELLADPAGVMARLSASLPLTVSQDMLSSAVRSDLRHHREVDSDNVLCRAPSGPPDEESLGSAILEEYPVEDTLAQFAVAVAERGAEMIRIGGLHSIALQTVDERDQQISDFDVRFSELGQKHAELHEQLSKLGDEHAYALDLIRSRDAQLKRVFSKPLIGQLFRAAWKYEQR
jgi:hypothetical protein